MNEDRSRAGHLRLVDSIEEMADEDLMVRYRAGQTEAFDVIVRRHRGPLMAFIRSGRFKVMTQMRPSSCFSNNTG